MPVQVTDNSTRIIADLTRKSNVALRFAVDRIDKTANPKTPKKEGFLRRDVLKQVLGLSGTIIWPKKYAQAQEAGVIRGHRVRNYTTAGTGPHFAENAVAQVVKTIAVDFKKAGLI